MKKRKVLYLLPLAGLILGGCDFAFNPDDPVGSAKEFLVTQVWRPVKEFFKENILGIKEEEKKEEQKPSEQEKPSGEDQKPSGGEQGGEVTPEKTATSIAIKEGSVKTTFTVGEDFSVAGGKLIVSYNDNSTSEVDMEMSMIPNVPDMSAANDHLKVDVSYLNLETSYYISVEALPAPTVKAIAIRSGHEPQSSFYVGDEFSVAGGQLQVTMSDDTRQYVDMTLDMVTNAPDMSLAHENYEVVVEYQSKQTSYLVQVILADTREEVSIGISYEYNHNDPVEIANFEEELEFVEGKEYKFRYGAYPSEAVDSLGYGYYNRGETEKLAEKPTEIGEYTYKVYLSEGDELYKPAEKSVNFKIVAPVISNFELTSIQGLLPEDTLSEGEAALGSINVGYKNLKSVEGHIVLAKQAEADSNAAFDDNFIELKSPIEFTSDLTVELAGKNKFVLVFGSYDGTNFDLLDTLSAGKATTDRAKHYPFIRLVASPLGSNEVQINRIAFSYEVNGAPATTVLRGEKSDLFHNAQSAENNAYFYNSDESFNEELSNGGIKMRLKECSTSILFGTTLTKAELAYYKLSFYAKPAEGSKFIYAKGSEEVVHSLKLYSKLIDENLGRYGNNYVFGEVADDQSEWVHYEACLADFIDEPVDGIAGINLWLNRYCDEGFVLFDDLRLIQLPIYPVKYALSALSVSGATTEYEKGDAFTFDGEIVAHYNDGSTAVIPANDPGIEITEPNMNSSGEKTVYISYTEDGVTKSTSYTINVTGTDPKAEEVLPIFDDSTDLATPSSRRNPELSTYMGCVVASDETEVTYGASQHALRIGGPIAEEYCYYTVYLPETINADSVHVKFFAKGLPSNLILQLRDDEEKQKAQYSSSNTKADVTTDQSKSNKFTATDAGNDWVMYEHDFYTATVTNGVKVLRIMFRNVVTAEQSGVLDGIQVYAN